MINTERLCLGCMNDNGGEKVCPVCGYDSASSNPEHSLPLKFILEDRYFVGKVISENGQGITYIGWDNINDSIVKVKEYFPKGYAHRNPDKTVSILEGNEYIFNEGLLEFLEINREIMRSELQSLMPVTNVFEENGTAYAIETEIQGITLEDFLVKNGGLLKWEQVRALVLPLLDTIEGMNNIGIIHRGISTKTIIVCHDGKLRISDYAIKNLRINTESISAELFDGYSAPEQYGIEEWHTDKYTDVYSISAVLFRVLIGVVPPNAIDRIKADSMSIPAKFAEELPRHVLSAIANGLQVAPADRTKNIEIFKNELVYGEIKEVAPVKKAKTNETATTPQQKKKTKAKSAKYALISALITAVVFLGLAAALVFGVFKEEIFGTDSSSVPSETSSESAPVVDQIGDIESGAEVTAKLYKVPDLKGKYYSEIIEEDSYEMFEFVISSKQFSSDYPRGTVCSQSVTPEGDGVPRDTKIELVISLGPQEVKIPNLTGLTETEAKLELLKQGFLYNNIEVLEKYDAEKKSGVVLEQEPKYGEKINTDASVKIYINSYKSEDSSSSSN